MWRASRAESAHDSASEANPAVGLAKEKNSHVSCALPKLAIAQSGPATLRWSGSPRTRRTALSGRRTRTIGFELAISLLARRCREHFTAAGSDPSFPFP